MTMDSKPRYVAFPAGTEEGVSVVNTFVHVGPRRETDLIGTYKSAPIPSVALDEEQTSFGDDESEDDEVGEIAHLQTNDSFSSIRHTSRDSFTSTPTKTSDGYHVSVLNTFVHVDDAKGIEEDDEFGLTKPATAPAGYLDSLVPLETPDANDGDDEIMRYQTYDSFDSSLDAIQGASSISDVARRDVDSQATAQQRQALDLCSLVGGTVEPSQAPQPVTVMMPMMAMPMMGATLAAGRLQVPSSSPAPSSQQSSPRPEEAGSAGSKDAAALVLEQTAAGLPRVKWNVDGSKLWSKYKQIMSPEFQLDLRGAGLQPFKLMILAKETKKKGGHSFQNSKGKSELFLKCEASLPDTVELFKCRVKVSCDVTGIEFCRGPISHRFLERHCCALQPSDDDWDLLQVVDKVGKRFELCLEVLESKS